MHYPCVLKPLMLSASRGVIRADNPDQFIAAFHRITRILEQPDVVTLGNTAKHILVEGGYIAGREVALEELLDGGQRLKVLALFDKPDPLEGPFFEETIYVTPSRLPRSWQSRVMDATVQAVAALGLKGRVPFMPNCGSMTRVLGSSKWGRALLAGCTRPGTQVRS